MTDHNAVWAKKPTTLIKIKKIKKNDDRVGIQRATKIFLRKRM